MMITILRFLLFPLSIFYGVVVYFRNLFFDLSIFSSYKIPIPSIIIGNLSTGGTGKTPHTEYLVQLLSQHYETVVLSRGYGRNTKGFIALSDEHTALDVGDEPLQYYLKFKDKIKIFVCENRKVGIQKILKEHPQTSLILLDDALQHRKVKAGFSILLSDFKKPFFTDFILPTGNLREFRKGKKRASCCIYTKCDENINESKKQYYHSKFDAKWVKNCYFSNIKYGDFTSFYGVEESEIKNILLVCGIANPTPLEQHLKQKYKVETIYYPDHHFFNQNDLDQISKKFGSFAQESKIILTTEKDMVRLKNTMLMEKFKQFPWYYVPIEIEIDRKKQFNEEIINYVEEARRNSSLH